LKWFTKKLVIENFSCLGKDLFIPPSTYEICGKCPAGVSSLKIRVLRLVKEKIYDKVYGCKEIQYEPPSGILGFLYRKLKKFEVNRYQAVYDLLPSDKEKMLDVGGRG